MSADETIPTELTLAEIADQLTTVETPQQETKKSLMQLCKEKLENKKPASIQEARSHWKEITTAVANETNGTCDRTAVYKAAKKMEQEGYFLTPDSPAETEQFTAHIKKENIITLPRITPTEPKQATVQQTTIEPTTTLTPADGTQDPNWQYYQQPTTQEPTQQQAEPYAFIPPNKELVDSCTDILSDGINSIVTFAEDGSGKVTKVWQPTPEKLKRLGYNCAVIVGKGGKYVNPETLATLGLVSFFGLNALSTLPEIISGVKKLFNKGDKK
jgi:hypothetical protein